VPNLHWTKPWTLVKRLRQSKNTLITLNYGIEDFYYNCSQRKKISIKWIDITQRSANASLYPAFALASIPLSALTIAFLTYLFQPNHQHLLFLVTGALRLSLCPTDQTSTQDSQLNSWLCKTVQWDRMSPVLTGITAASLVATVVVGLLKVNG